MAIPVMFLSLAIETLTTHTIGPRAGSITMIYGGLARLIFMVDVVYHSTAMNFFISIPQKRVRTRTREVLTTDLYSLLCGITISIFGQTILGKVIHMLKQPGTGAIVVLTNWCRHLRPNTLCQPYPLFNIGVNKVGGLKQHFAITPFFAHGHVRSRVAGDMGFNFLPLWLSFLQSCANDFFGVLRWSVLPVVVVFQTWLCMLHLSNDLQRAFHDQHACHGPHTPYYFRPWPHLQNGPFNASCDLYDQPYVLFL